MTPNPFTDASTGLVDSFLDHVCWFDTLQIINVRFDASEVCLTPNSRHNCRAPGTSAPSGQPLASDCRSPVVAGPTVRPNAANWSVDLEEQTRFGGQLIVPVSSGPRHWLLPWRLCAGTGSIGPTGSRGGPTDAHGASTPTAGRAPRGRNACMGYRGPPRPLQGAIDPNTGISVVAPPTFEDEAPARAATREEVAAEAVSIRSDASSAFGGKADAIEAGQFRQ